MENAFLPVGRPGIYIYHYSSFSFSFIPGAQNLKKSFFLLPALLGLHLSFFSNFVLSSLSLFIGGCFIDLRVQVTNTRRSEVPFFTYFGFVFREDPFEDDCCTWRPWNAWSINFHRSGEAWRDQTWIFLGPWWGFMVKFLVGPHFRRAGINYPSNDGANALMQWDSLNYNWLLAVVWLKKPYLTMLFFTGKQHCQKGGDGQRRIEEWNEE